MLDGERFDLPFSNISPFIFTAAEAYFALGYSMIPLHGDADLARAKVAAVPWKDYQQAKPSLSQLRQWFVQDEFPALGIITGSVSRLVVLDFDSPELFRDFKSRFPDLAEKHIIQTRRGFHIYYHLPSGLSVPTRKGGGIDLLSDGCYVVARPSTIAGHTYKLVQGGQPRVLSVDDVHRIRSFIEEAASCQLPVASEELRQSHSGRKSLDVSLANDYQPPAVNLSRSASLPPQNLLLSTQYPALSSVYRYLASKGEGRNRALFLTSLIARDNGFTCEETLQTLVEVHVKQPSGGDHMPESPDVRRREAQNTICSAYSRDPRPGKKFVQFAQIFQQNGLPNTVREALFGKRLTGAVRLWEALGLKGIRPGEIFTAAQAVELLGGIIGRDSVYNALNVSVNGEALFEQLGAESPSGHPRASDDAADDTKTDQPNKCIFGRAQKSGIIQRGPKTRLFIMPDALDWCRILGVKPAHSDPLTLDDLSSAKLTRMGVHRELIKRRPGEYPRRWLAKRLGIRVKTIDHYNAEIPIHRVQRFIERRVYWSNLNIVPDDMHIGGAFLEDSTGKRYPAKRQIAAKLLAKGKLVTYKRQDVNYYWYGEDSPEPIPAAHVEKPAPAQYLSIVPEPGRVERLNVPVKIAHIKGAANGVGGVGHGTTHRLSPTKSPSEVGFSSVINGRDVSRPYENAGSPLKSVRPTAPPKPERPPSGKRRLKNPDQEALACRVIERVNRLCGDPNQYISIAGARRLVCQYDRALIDKTLNILETRRNISRPAGFFITVLRSEAKRKRWEAPA